MNELNLKLQGKDNFICDLYRIIKGFRRKLSLFEVQVEGGNVFHFQCFKKFRAGIADVNLGFRKEIIRDLNKHFIEIFSVLDIIENDILLFQNPFDCNLDDLPVELTVRAH
ncbi:uncharacterized protein LOC106878876 [Octopus bimaculoides]|uniref:uncharacterized protein LOC106878876 n=1 Tax=Octopus bimaculoides TaxID=37653 RepID=UPI00071D86B3|nr:uncharacterized protein LOC106878876 [Octopus bimaculoides]|eukprot:XP_014783707.1 PREDICTED: uncharacterized protein LOC106878876 [Octopus bimaculoides]